MRWDNERRSDNVEDQRFGQSQPRSALSAAPLLLRLLPFYCKTALAAACW